MVESVIKTSIPSEFEEIKNIGHNCKHCTKLQYVGNDDFHFSLHKCTEYNQKILFIPDNLNILKSNPKIERDIDGFLSDFIPTDNCPKFKETGIRIDCYLSVMKKYKNYFQNAHFESITRKFDNHVLSPSKNLLYTSKREKWDFKKYSRAFIEEINNSNAAKKKLEKLKKIANKQTLFLVCVEKNPTICHRSIVKKMLELDIKWI